MLHRLANFVKGWFAQRRQPAARFVWNVKPKRIGEIRPGMVYCIEIPVSKPLQMLEEYKRAGVVPQRVVFAGDARKLSDDEYYGITRMGAIVHETTKKNLRQRTQEEVTGYYFDDVSGSRGPKAESDHRYPDPYDPGDPKISAEQLQALIDAVARNRH